MPIAKLVGVAVACFGTVAICNHATRPAALPRARRSRRTAASRSGLPLAALLMLIFLVGLTFLAKRTTFGRHVYAVGGNAEAARRSGINVARIRILVFMISGIMAGVGGIVLAARLQSVNLQPGRRDAAPRLDLGRRHRRRQPVRRTREVRGALLGSLVIATVANGLNIGGYSTGTIYIVTGVILLLAVTLDSVATATAGTLGPLSRRSTIAIDRRKVRRGRSSRPSGNRIAELLRRVAAVPRPKCTLGSSDER